MEAARRDRAIDAVLAVGTAVVVGASVLFSGRPVGWVVAAAGAGLALVVGVLLLFRRKRPVGVLLAIAAAVLAYNTAGFPGVGAIWPLVVGLYTTAVMGRVPIAVAVAVAMLGIDLTWLLAEVRLSIPTVLGFAVTNAVIAGLAIALGDAVRSRRGWAAETRQRLRRMSEDKELENRRRLVEERMRIARELHDVTAHTLAVVGVQVHVAGDALPGAPEEARRALETAHGVIAQATDELKASVRVLRDGDKDAATDREPLPGLADLEALVHSTRAPGLEVELSESGERGVVPGAVALTTYRVVQEALANVVRHAGARRARVEVDYRPDHVALRIGDDGRACADPVVPGNGLTGLRERVEGVGGRMRAGPTPEGGFEVSALLPMREVERAHSGE